MGLDAEQMMKRGLQRLQEAVVRGYEAADFDNDQPAATLRASSRS